MLAPGIVSALTPEGQALLDAGYDPRESDYDGDCHCHGDSCEAARQTRQAAKDAAKTDAKAADSDGGSEKK
ncbi:MAG: hypothetical protein LBF77_06595 [Spirochaetaceae bacterium]|jgi:hypothetical protein|nr:hypothetical protein [Spirochaetaceae bacterium]